MSFGSPGANSTANVNYPVVDRPLEELTLPIVTVKDYFESQSTAFTFTAADTRSAKPSGTAADIISLRTLLQDSMEKVTSNAASPITEAALSIKGNNGFHQSDSQIKLSDGLTIRMFSMTFLNIPKGTRISLLAVDNANKATQLPITWCPNYLTEAYAGSTIRANGAVAGTLL